MNFGLRIAATLQMKTKDNNPTGREEEHLTTTLEAKTLMMEEIIGEENYS